MKRLQRNFKPWPENQERLKFAEEKLGLNPAEIINEVLRENLRKHLEVKTKKIRDQLNVPIP